MKSEEFINDLPAWADEYIDNCLGHSKLEVSAGKAISVPDRHIPTIDFFLTIWLPKNKLDSISRRTWYLWLNSDDEVKMHTIKSIDNKFKALAADIVANEGKGIFYAKNKLGWTDKQIQDINLTNINANFGNSLQSPSESKEGT